MRPLIAITVGEVINFDTGVAWTPTIYGQFRTYTDAVVRAGGAPFIIPLVDDEAALRRLYDQCGGLLLSGGHDLKAATGDNPPPRVTMTTSPRRDKQEKQLLKWALEDDKPVLGICRGMQLLNVVLGGDLYHDIESELKSGINHTLGIDKKDVRHLVHSITLAPDSQLAVILGTHEVPTNSLHHQAVRELGKGLVVTARSDDGVIEAVELPGKRFVIGVQSHPEVLEDGPWAKLFEAFVSAVA